MASEDINTAISIGQAVWGVIVIVAGFSTLAAWIKFNIKALRRENEARKADNQERKDEIEELDKNVRFIRENWVTEQKLDKKLEDLSTNIANAIIVKMDDRKWDGMERRGPRQ